jgi:hypothetical protein
MALPRISTTMITRAQSTTTTESGFFWMGENRCCCRAAGIANTMNAAMAAT